MECKICNKKCDSTKGLSIHLTKNHKLNDTQLKEYYDNYLKTKSSKCYFCDNEAKFMGFTKGYHKICDSKECLGKTRATGTFEFLMYKYDLSEKEAKIMQQERADERGKKIKNSLDKKFEENKNFHKERSHQTKEFWIKKGLNEEDAIKKAEEVMKMIHEKTWTKRKNNPELYKDINTSQLKYWLKKGFTNEEAYLKLKERQTTNTLENYIKKYGENEGYTKFIERNKKWSKNIETRYKNGEFSKCSKNNCSKQELELIQIIVERTNIEDYKYADKQFFMVLNNKTYSYDFKYKNKIIEFNGDYWHCNPNLYKPDFFNIHKQMMAKDIWRDDLEKMILTKEKGYDYLIIWESEYKKNREECIERCIKFLTE